MAAATGPISLKYYLLRGLKVIPRTRYGVNSSTTAILTNQLFNGNRTISTSHNLTKDKIESDATSTSGSVDEVNTKKNENEKRADLEKLKKLLLQQKSRAREDNSPNKPRSKQKKPKTQASSSVNVAQIRDILDSLNRREGHFPVNHDKIPTVVNEKPEAVESRIEEIVKVKPTQSVEAAKFRNALSALGQDSSIAEEVIMAGRQISSESRSTIQGAYNIKQRQFRDKDTRKRMARSSLKTGPRLHMFDEVQEKWSDGHDALEKSIFQEMAEQEVKDLGMSATVQSGFHDLMDNIHRQWMFPVDNESCKSLEEDVGFDEHVFLEHHLADFPKTGNIRQFMELVVTGLQQNPHLGVQEKKEHIEWFKEYFENMPDEQVQL